MSRFPLNTENVAKMVDVGETLLGTCGDVDDELSKAFGEEGLTLVDFSAELLRELDDTAMLCEACGWWCEPGELDDDQVCGDCSSE